MLLLSEFKDMPCYSTKIFIFSFIWAGLAALHKASTIKCRLCKVYPKRHGGGGHTAATPAISNQSDGTKV